MINGKKVDQYLLIQEESKEEFEQEVREFLAAGWCLYGFPQIHIGMTASGGDEWSIYNQVVVKYK